MIDRPTDAPPRPVTPFSLEYVEFVASYCANEPTRCPTTAGSIVRGALGHALLDLACAAGRGGIACRNKKECVQPGRCDVQRAFSPLDAHGEVRGTGGSHSPPPAFVLNVPRFEERRGGRFHHEVRLRLLGSGIYYAPLFCQALERAGARGLGPTRVGWELVDIRDGHTGQLVYRDYFYEENARVYDIVSPGRLDAIPVQEIELHFESLTEIKHNGRTMARPSPASLLANAYRRVSSMTSAYGGQPPDRAWKDELARVAKRCKLETVRVDGASFARRSGRQPGTKRHSGFVGTFALSGDIRGALPWLRAASRLQIGKQCSHGHGAFRIAGDEP